MICGQPAAGSQYALCQQCYEHYRSEGRMSNVGGVGSSGRGGATRGTRRTDDPLGENEDGRDMTYTQLLLLAPDLIGGSFDDDMFVEGRTYQSSLLLYYSFSLFLSISLNTLLCLMIKLILYNY